MRIVLVLIVRRSVGKREGLTHEQHALVVRGIWGAILLIQESPTLVKLLDMRTPEVILI